MQISHFLRPVPFPGEEEEEMLSDTFSLPDSTLCSVQARGSFGITLTRGTCRGGPSSGPWAQGGDTAWGHPSRAPHRQSSWVSASSQLLPMLVLPGGAKGLWMERGLFGVS